MSENLSSKRATPTPFESHEGLFTFRNIERNSEREKQLVDSINKEVQKRTKTAPAEVVFSGFEVCGRTKPSMPRAVLRSATWCLYDD